MLVSAAGFEPATHALKVQRYLSFQRLTNYREPPKSLEGTSRTESCGLGCGLEIQGQRILARLGSPIHNHRSPLKP